SSRFAPDGLISVTALRLHASYRGAPDWAEEDVRRVGIFARDPYAVVAWVDARAGVITPSWWRGAVSGLPGPDHRKGGKRIGTVWDRGFLHPGVHGCISAGR